MQNHSQKTKVLLAIILGVVFIGEISHIYSSFHIWGYYPGLYTGIALIIIGYFYWREMFKSKLIFNT